jgi:hypothetical protein
VAGAEEILFLLFPLHYAAQVRAYGGKCCQFAAFFADDDPSLAAKAEELCPVHLDFGFGKTYLGQIFLPFPGRQVSVNGIERRSTPRCCNGAQTCREEFSTVSGIHKNSVLSQKICNPTMARPEFPDAHQLLKDEIPSCSIQ